MNTIHITFPEGKHKVLTFSYDDGRAADKRLVELFNRYQLRATFHLNSGFIQEDIQGIHDDYLKSYQLRNLFNGHEVACHTVTHPTIARTPVEHVADQLITDRKNLEKVMGYPVQGFSYPNGSYNPAIIEMLPNVGIKYARVVGSSEQFAIPDDFYQWQATCHHNNRLLELGEQFKSLGKVQYLYMMSVWGHSFEFDRDDNWSLIEAFCEQMASQTDIWFATNIEIVRYLEAAKQLVIGLNGDFAYNPTAIPVWINVNGLISQIAPGETKRLKKPIEVVIIGDSTVQTQLDDSDPQSGWGGYLQKYCSTNVIVKNYAIGGRSSKSFLAEGRLAALDYEIEQANFVLIQWGHNDASKQRPDRYTDPSTSFKNNLKHYLDFARDRHATPILVTPPLILSRANETYKNELEQYWLALCEIAKDEQVALIDLTTLSLSLYEQLSAEQVDSFYLSSLGTHDTTHFTRRGASMLAKLIARQLKQTLPEFKSEVIL
ncbi:polysaccharide deacetylase family protein [Amphibacillus marinus]